MKADDYTHVGKGGERFRTTHWTAIEEIRVDNGAHTSFLIGELLRDYWRPVYCYLRRKGYGNEEAKDMTQGFFQEVVLGRRLIQRADSTRGRFRTLLLTALDRYVANIHRARAAQKRIPQEKLIPLESADIGDLPQAAADLTLEESFNYAWVSDLLDRILEDVEADCCKCGLATHWKLFHDRVLQPIMQNENPPALGDLCAKHGIDEPMKASNMIFAVKRRVRTALKRYVRQSVASEAEISEEMAELTRFLVPKQQDRR